jgi:hypothetical protein
MAAKTKTPAVAAAAPSPSAAAGSGWLYRVYGSSPARGDRPLAVYLLHPKLLTPGALGRLAALLSGDARFEGRVVWAWELPRAVTGHVVVDLKAERALATLPEDARKALPEIARALEELSARRPAAALDWASFHLDELARLRDWLRERGVTSFTVRALGSGAAVELHPPRPMGAEERRELWEQVQDILRRTVRPLVEDETEARALGEIGLGALAELAPQQRWWYDTAEESWRESFFLFSIGEIYPPPPRRSRLDDVRIEGPRGTSLVDGQYVYAILRRLDGDLVSRAEEAAEEAGELSSQLKRWHNLLEHLRWAERTLTGAAPLAAAAEEGEAKVWEEDGRVRVWLPPETAADIAGRWGDVPSYLRALSEVLGLEVEPAGREEGLPLVSPEVDEAYWRLVAALKGLVGAA